MRTVRLLEIAEILGVTKQRAHQLAEEQGFPAPLAEDGRARLWSRREAQGSRGLCCQAKNQLPDLGGKRRPPRPLARTFTCAEPAGGANEAGSRAQPGTSSRSRGSTRAAAASRTPVQSPELERPVLRESTFN
jgi:hypothetical protein